MSQMKEREKPYWLSVGVRVRTLGHPSGMDSDEWGGQIGLTGTVESWKIYPGRKAIVQLDVPILNKIDGKHYPFWEFDLESLEPEKLDEIRSTQKEASKSWRRMPRYMHQIEKSKQPYYIEDYIEALEAVVFNKDARGIPGVRKARQIKKYLETGEAT